MLYYGLLQLTVWWFCHEVALFWTIRFPIHAKTFVTSHRVKYVHITMVVVGLALPTLPVIVTLTTGDPSGFGMTRFPPILCTGLQNDSTFYSLVLPINILMMVGIPLLIIIFWTIHKVMTARAAEPGRARPIFALRTRMVRADNWLLCSLSRQPPNRISVPPPLNDRVHPQCMVHENDSYAVWMAT